MARDYVPAKVPLVGDVLSVILQMSTFGVLTFCLTRRTQHIKKWRNLPLAQWLILVIYVDSALFVLTTSVIVHGFGINSSRGVCEGGILLCLVCYMTTKILIYYFLVERAYIVGGSLRPRIKTKLWLFNCLFMLLPYTIFVIMNFIYRITYINDAGVCIIGMQKIAMLPLITFEVIVNVYLTLLFVLPIRSLPSYKSRTSPALHRMAHRSFIGSCATLTTSVVNLTVLMVLKGEPGWICLMCCNADILFCVIVLHWVSSKEHKEESTVSGRNGGGYGGGYSGGNGVGTVGSNRDRSRRVSALVRDVVEAEKKSMSIHRGRTGRSGTLTSLSAAPSKITTECKSSKGSVSAPSAIIRVLHRRGSSWDGSVKNVRGRGVRNDDVELNGIRVQTVHTRSVEGEGRTWMKRNSDSDDVWVGSRKGVVGERMV